MAAKEMLSINPGNPQLKDFITILTSADGKILTKRHTPTETIPYDKGYLFTSKQVPITSLQDLANALECRPQSCVVLGKIRDGVDPSKPHRRLLYPARDGTPPSYEPAAHSYLILDIDENATVAAAWLNDMPATMRRVLEWLPPELREVDLKWRVTGSAGIKPGIRLRLAFLLDRLVSADELKAWFADRPNVDLALFRPVQPIYGSPVFEDGLPDPVERRFGGFPGNKQQATPPADLAERIATAKTEREHVKIEHSGQVESGRQTVEEWDFEEIVKMVSFLDPPENYDADIFPMLASIASFNIPSDADMSRRRELICDWACSGSVKDNDKRGFWAAFGRAAKPRNIGPGTLIGRAQEKGYLVPSKQQPPDDRADEFDAFIAEAAAYEAALAAVLAARDPTLMPADTVLAYEDDPDAAKEYDDPLDIPPMKPIRAGSQKGQAMLEKLIADLGGVAGEPSTKRNNRFGGRLPSAHAAAPPITYWDNHQTLPKGPVVGLTIGETGSHKTGLFLKYALDAIDRGARILYIAAEGAHGIGTARLPKAKDARNMSWETLDAAWRTEAETFNLLNLEDHELLYEAYRDFKPNIIFIDVLTKVAAGDINTPQVAAAIMNAANMLAQRFNATVNIAHHPGKDAAKGAMGSNLFPSLADFMWCVGKDKDGKVWLKVTKMKDGKADHSVCYSVDTTQGVPVIRDPKVGELMAERAARVEPVAAAIKDFLSSRPSETFDMGGLVEELRAIHAIRCGVKRPDALIRGLVEDGDLEGFVEVRGRNHNRRYSFRRAS